MSFMQNKLSLGFLNVKALFLTFPSHPVKCRNVYDDEFYGLNSC